MMSDVNELTQAKGRGELGGNPGGVVHEETFNWWWIKSSSTGRRTSS